jgi:hypothetical protein
MSLVVGDESGIADDDVFEQETAQIGNDLRELCVQKFQDAWFMGWSFRVMAMSERTTSLNLSEVL